VQNTWNLDVFENIVPEAYPDKLHMDYERKVINNEPKILD
jgi:hypothetical protein